MYRLMYHHHGMVGVMRPGTLINRKTRKKSVNPVQPDFFTHQNYSQSTESLVYNTSSSIHCCMYFDYDGSCHNRVWSGAAVDNGTRDETWRESFTRDGSKFGMLLDLDEGTLSVYQEGQSLGVMMRGLVGHYCWVVSVFGGAGAQVTIEREKIPESMR